MKVISKVAVIVGISSLPAFPAGAQLFYVGVRGGAGIPKGEFSTATTATGDNLGCGARPGLGYGLDAGLSLGPLLGLYASTDRINFDCLSQSCSSAGKYKLKGVSGGLRLGIPMPLLLPLPKPWVKAGVTYNQMTGTVGPAATKITSTKRPGYELGAGVDLPVMSFFSITPQVRYVRQRMKYNPRASSSISGATRDANYYTFDLGFRFRSPI